MKLTPELVDRLAFLSRLEFEGDAKSEMMADLDKMLGFVEKLNAVDTDGVEPLIHMSKEVNVLRPDAEGAMLSQAEALKNAPKKDEYYFRVPKVISND